MKDLIVKWRKISDERWRVSVEEPGGDDFFLFVYHDRASYYVVKQFIYEKLLGAQ